MKSLVFYLLGVISVEIVVIYFTLLFAKKLVANQKLMKAIDIFGILFLLLLAYSFYSHANQTTESKANLEVYLKYSPFLAGFFLNCLNFLQLPFWTGWNLYLMNGNYISIEKKGKYYYIFGTALGTFLGMLTLIGVLQTLSENTSGFSKYIMPIVIPLFFVVLACLQIFKVYKKYLR
jgi:threonine/homoserine/homoserine lactone efflux protein